MPRTALRQLDNGFEHFWVVLAYTVAMLAVGFHLRHGIWSAFTTLGQNYSAKRRDSFWNPRRRRRRGHHRRLPRAAVLDLLLRLGRLTCPRTSLEQFHAVGDDIADTKAPDGPIERRWDERKFSAKLVNPANRRKLTVIVVGTGLAGGSAAATLGEAGYHVKSLLLPGQPAPRALDRRAGRHQRRQELPQRRRLDLPALLRHGQGRRLPRPRVQRLPARRRSA